MGTYWISNVTQITMDVVRIGLPVCNTDIRTWLIGNVTQIAMEMGNVTQTRTLLVGNFTQADIGTL